MSRLADRYFVNRHIVRKVIKRLGAKWIEAQPDGRITVTDGWLLHLIDDLQRAAREEGGDDG